MEIPSCCPSCDEPYRWEIDLAVDRELAWMAPDSPGFAFRCASCEELVEISFDWKLEQGDHPRRLALLGGPTPLKPRPCILLVDLCPHGCGAKLGLQLDPEDPWARGVAWPDESVVLGGYRCPTCDGEGRLRIQPVVGAADDEQQQRAERATTK